MERITASDEEICLGCDERNPYGSMSPPIVQTSLFGKRDLQELFDGLSAEHLHHMYTRGTNPTVQALESKLAALERGEAAKCFASGMAAISAVFLGLLKAGDHVLFVNHVYGPTLQLADHLTGFGICHSRVFDCNLEAVRQALRPETRMIYFESPGTMLFRTLPISDLTTLAQEKGILTAMDNTWATPLFQKPLTLGVDLSIHSCTKYIGGHSDVVAGVVVSRTDLMERIFYKALLLNGGVLTPFDAWLLIRGLRTLPVRMAGHQSRALEVARFLEGHPRVRRVFHPGLTRDSSGPEELQGYSGLFSFEIVDDGYEGLRSVVDRLSVFRIGVSWGGVESLVLTPNRGDNLGQLEAEQIPPGLIRLSIGLEPPELLIRDLGEALA